jgi:hypothetical protein
MLRDDNLLKFPTAARVWPLSAATARRCAEVAELIIDRFEAEQVSLIAAVVVLTDLLADGCAILRRHGRLDPTLVDKIASRLALPSRLQPAVRQSANVTALAEHKPRPRQTPKLRLYRPGSLLGRLCRIQCTDGRQHGTVVAQSGCEVEVRLRDGRIAFGQAQSPDFELVG